MQFIKGADVEVENHRNYAKVLTVAGFALLSTSGFIIYS